MFDYRFLKGSYCVAGIFLFIGMIWICGSGCASENHEDEDKVTTISAALNNNPTEDQINAWNSSAESAIPQFAEIQIANCGNT